jgi:hypothetical protein
MVTIHIEPKKYWHFPVTKHHSFYRKNEGWLVAPGEVNPNLSITDGSGENTKVLKPEEVIHIVLPPETK